MTNGPMVRFALLSLLAMFLPDHPRQTERILLTSTTILIRICGREGMTRWN